MPGTRPSTPSQQMVRQGTSATQQMVRQGTSATQQMVRQGTSATQQMVRQSTSATRRLSSANQVVQSPPSHPQPPLNSTRRQLSNPNTALGRGHLSQHPPSSTSSQQRHQQGIILAS